MAASRCVWQCLAFFSLFTCSVANGVLIYESSYSYELSGHGPNGNKSALVTQAGDLVTTITTPSSKPIATLGFNVRTIPTSPTQLKAGAGLSVVIDHRDNATSWSSLKMTAKGKSTLMDSAFVEGIPGVAGGTIQITWAVTGVSNILLDATVPNQAPNASNAFFVNDLATVALLTSTVPSDSPDLFVNDQANGELVGNGNNIIESMLPQSSGFQTFILDWIAGELVDIQFNLDVTSILEVSNADAAGFSANVDADFSNTANLHDVSIFNAAGELQDGAMLVGNGGFVYAPTAVPEPSTLLVWCIGAGLFGFCRLHRRRR